MADVTSMLEAADRNVQRISTPSETQRAVDEIVKIAEHYHASTFVAASSAVRSIAAIVTAAFTQVEHVTIDQPAVTILLDVNFASGTEFSRAAAKARQDGARIVIGLALYCLASSGPTAKECGLDALVFVHDDERTDPRRSSVGEEFADLRASGLAF
jgi:hypothetical protein